MSTSLFGVGASVNVNVNGTLVPQSFVGTAGQTLFNITSFIYTPGTNSLLVFINGQRQITGRDFVETSTSSFTLVEGVVAGDFVDIIGFPMVNLTAVLPGSITLGNNYSLQNYIDDLWVNVKESPYNAQCNGVTDDTLAIQLALNTGKNVLIPSGTALISSTLLFTAHGQTISGSGVSTFSAVPPCTLQWVGNSTTPMVSFDNGVTGYSNCTLKEIRLNGNNLANSGIAVSTGRATYRNRIERVFIEFISAGANPTGILMGLGAFPNFSNDVVVRDCYLGGCTISMSGSGATYQVSNTTMLQTAGTTAIVATAGSYWTFSQCVFSGGGTQVVTTSPQCMSFFACWFENSTVAIYRSTTSHYAVWVGCYLHTLSATQLMDMNGAAGNWSVINCFSPSVSASFLINNINTTYDYTLLGSDSVSTNKYRQRIIGYMRADQALFAAAISGDIATATGDGTVVSLNNVAFTEQIDMSGLFDAATGILTTPVDANWELTGQIYLSGLLVGHTDAILSLIIAGQSYMLARINPGAVRTGAGELCLSGSIRVPMSAAQTAYLQIAVFNGTKVVSILAGGNVNNWRMRFSGRMI